MYIIYIYYLCILFIYIIYIYYLCILFMYIIYVYYLYILFMYIIYVYYLCILFIYIIYVYYLCILFMKILCLVLPPLIAMYKSLCADGLRGLAPASVFAPAALSLLFPPQSFLLSLVSRLEGSTTTTIFAPQPQAIRTTLSLPLSFPLSSPSLSSLRGRNMSERPCTSFLSFRSLFSTQSLNILLL